MPKRCDTVLQDNRTGMDREVGEIQIARSGKSKSRHQAPGRRASLLPRGLIRPTGSRLGERWISNSNWQFNS